MTNDNKVEQLLLEIAHEVGIADAAIYRLEHFIARLPFDHAGKGDARVNAIAARTALDAILDNTGAR